MGLLILAGVVGVVATVLIARSSWAEDFMEWFLCSLLGLIVGMTTLVVGIIPGLIADTSPVSPQKQAIYAIKDNNESHGSFALGFGSVDEEQYYYYVVEDASGFKTIKKSEVDESKIKEENIDQPYVLIYEQRFDSALARFMYGKYSGYNTYEFHVPKNTVTTEYNIDLE
ncbi:hypothetical protein [Heyndrickxia oleronia]|uniref:Uncharacterized protein n=1 Tax=Heyndrickxia oleronia TaxID=38875 RepID=A0AAW6SRG6_9BACI|nr:hypothetical protein [Heyndrickxia oleronia]MDH5159857.1 hypothetical protein [Heyndrickxia oleronia]